MDATQRWPHLEPGSRRSSGSRQLPSAGRLRPNAARLSGTLSDGSTIESYLALIHAGLCRDGVERMRADAGVAVTGWLREPLVGAGAAVRGSRPPAGRRGRPGRRDPGSGGGDGHPRPRSPATATALAERARWRSDARTGVRPRRSRGERSRSSGPYDWTIIPMPPWCIRWWRGSRYAGAMYRGPRSSWRGPLACGRCSPTRSPGVRCRCWWRSAHAYLALDDGSGAKAVLQQSRDILGRRPDLGDLSRQTEELGSKVGSDPWSDRGGLLSHHRGSCGCAAAVHPPHHAGDRRAAVLSPHTVRSQAEVRLPQARRDLAQPAIERTQQIRSRI